MENIENKDNTKKRIILSSLIIVVSVIIIGVSISYAYYLNTVEEVNPANQIVNFGSSGELVMNLTTEQLIEANAADLINDADILSSNDYTAFRITLPSDAVAASANYNLYLTDIKMTNNFKSGYVKWALYSSANEQLATGTFNDVTLSSSANSDGTYNAENITILNNLNINRGDTISYKLYIWLSNDPNYNQIELLNGSLSAKVGFRATTS